MIAQTPDLREISERLEKLETAFERMGKALKSRTIEAEKFALVNKEGKPRAELVLSPYGQLSFILRDKNGTPRADVIVAKSGLPGFNLFDADGKIRAGFTILRSGTVGLCIYDELGNPCAALEISKEGEPSLHLAKDGDVLFEAP